MLDQLNILSAASSGALSHFILPYVLNRCEMSSEVETGILVRGCWGFWVTPLGARVPEKRLRMPWGWQARTKQGSGAAFLRMHTVSTAAEADEEGRSRSSLRIDPHACSVGRA